MVNYTCANPDGNTGWTDWADEYFTIYPDGVAVRNQVLWTSNFENWHEFQETIVINGPGQRPEDNIQPVALTVGNMKGETATYSWENGPPAKAMDKPANPNIQVVNLKSNWKPFQIVSPVNSSMKAYTGEVTYSMFEWWNHWPVAQVRSSGISAAAPEPGHPAPRSPTFIGTHMQNPIIRCLSFCSSGAHHQAGGGLSAAEIVALRAGYRGARRRIPEPRIRSNPARLCIVRQESKTAPQLQLSLNATSESPILNAAIVIKHWGDAEPKLRIDGKAVVRGPAFRYGFVFSPGRE